MSTPTQDKTLDTILKTRLGTDPGAIASLCQKFQIIELGLFGSVLRDDFRPEGDNPSDIDLLIVFDPSHRATWKTWLDLNQSFETLFNRKVDIVRKSLLKNPYRRAEILRTNRIIYEQR